MIEYFLVFIAGLLGSFHCIGMCGVFPLSIASIPKQCCSRKVSSQILYNFGRLFTYTFLGALTGFLGFKISEFKPILGGQVIISALAGVLMICLGLQIVGVIGEKKIPGFTLLYSLLKKVIATFLNHKSITGSFYLGIFNGFLPCPLVYAFLLTATASGSPIEGALIMLSLGSGTIPLMFFLGGLGETLTPKFRTRLSRIPGYLVLIFGIITIVRAFIPYVSVLGINGHFFH